MIKNPKIIQIDARPTAVIHLVIPKDQIQKVMGPGVGELISTIAAQEIVATGPWYTHHFKIDDAGWDFEIGVPVAKPVTAKGRVKPGEWPAMKASRAVYQGPYEGLGEAWAEFMDWMEAGGHEAAEDLYECYVKGPESGEDPLAWRTEFTKQILN